MIKADRGILGREAPGRERAHRVVAGIEPAHPGELQRDCAQQREKQVSRADPAPHLDGPGEDLVRALGGLGTKKLHATDPQERQHHDGHHDNAEAADPIRERAPEQQAGRILIEAKDDGRAGCREARHRFEKGISDGQFVLSEDERQGTSCHRREPRHRGQHEALVEVQLEFIPPVRKHQRSAEKDCRNCGCYEGPPVGVVEAQVDKGGHEHDAAQPDQEKADHVKDRTEASG